MAQEACLTLYNVTKKPQAIIEAMKHYFEDITISIVEEKRDALTITLFDESTVALRLLNDEEELKKQTVGMANYFHQAPCLNKELMKNIELQISLFSCITSFTFLVDEEENRTNAIIGRIYAIAKDCAAIILYPDMSLYNSDGVLILDMEGKSELDTFTPIASTDMLARDVTYQEEDQQAFTNIMEELKGKGYPVIEHIISTQLTNEIVSIPSIEEIAQRLSAVFACAVCAEGMLMEGGSKDIGLAEFIALDRVFGCGSYLSEEERSFIEEGDQQQAINISWRYECAAVLLWMLNFIELDTSFDQLCDVQKISKLLRQYHSLEELIEHSQLRSEAEVLAMHTRVLYTHYSCVEAKQNNQSLVGINPEVVHEVHYTLNWLANANQTRNWDRISCHT